MFYICTLACVSAYHETQCPVLGATFFWALHCAVELTETSVSGAASSFLGQTCQHSVTQHQSQPGPTSAWLWAFISAQRSWRCSGSPACSLIPVPSGPPGTLILSSRQSAWSSTEPSAFKLILEGKNSKAWGRYKITLQSPARKVTPGLGVSLETTGFQF